jgi:hypothetical protein
MSRAEDWAEIDDVTCKVETEKALLCVIDKEELWIPKSVMSEDSEVQGKGDSGTLVVKEWYALKEHLE